MPPGFRPGESMVNQTNSGINGMFTTQPKQHPVNVPTEAFRLLQGRCNRTTTLSKKILRNHRRSKLFQTSNLINCQRRAMAGSSWAGKAIGVTWHELPVTWEYDPSDPLLDFEIGIPEIASE